MQICGVVGAHHSGAELSFIKWYYTSHISKIKIKLKSVCWSIESITLTVYSLFFFLYEKTVASKCAITAIFFVFVFLSRCFPLTSFHLAISDVYFACVFILQRTVCEFDVLWWLGLIATCHFFAISANFLRHCILVSQIPFSIYSAYSFPLCFTISSS